MSASPGEEAYNQTYLEAVVFAVGFLLDLNAQTRFVSFADVDKALAVDAVLYPSVEDAQSQAQMRRDLDALFVDFGARLIGASAGKRAEIIRGALR